MAVLQRVHPEADWGALKSVVEQNPDRFWYADGMLHVTATRGRGRGRGRGWEPCLGRPWPRDGPRYSFTRGHGW